MTVGPALRTEAPHIIHFFEQDVIAFQIIESPDGDSARMDVGGKVRGVLRPFLRWTNHYEPVTVSNPTVGSSMYGHH